MNKVILSGNIIGNTDKAPKMITYFKGDENKKSVMNFFVSTLIPHAKKDDEGHYPSELHAVKAFSQNADFINQYFTGGSAITLEGYLKEEKGDAKDDGTKYPDRTYTIVESVEFPPAARGKAKESGAISSSNATSTKKATAKKSGLAMPF